MRSTAVLVFVVVVGLVGCGSDHCDTSAIDGIYLLTYDEQPGGTCGPLDADEWRVLDNGWMANLFVCHTVAATPSEDECDHAWVLDCGDAGTRHMSLTIDDEVHLHGELLADFGVCQSLYTITAIRE